MTASLCVPYHKNRENLIEYLAIKTIILNGSLAIVKINRAAAGPNARKVQPKNSITVILKFWNVNQASNTVDLKFIK